MADYLFHVYVDPDAPAKAACWFDIAHEAYFLKNGFMSDKHLPMSLINALPDFVNQAAEHWFSSTASVEETVEALVGLGFHQHPDFAAFVEMRHLGSAPAAGTSSFRP